MVGGPIAGVDPVAILAGRMGDTALVLGHRISEWCGLAPALEEDIALANTALDLIGQAKLWLDLAGAREGLGRDADGLAYLRDAWDFRNLLLVERPNGDFGDTILRQALFDGWHVQLLAGLRDSSDEQVAAIAAKASKEAAYHWQRSRETVIALGDGTEESQARMQAALVRAWPFVGEMFESDETDAALSSAGIAPAPATLSTSVMGAFEEMLAEATLRAPEVSRWQTGGRSGRMHTEHLGHMLSTMQWLQRAYPGCDW